MKTDVRVHEDHVTLPTYEPMSPDKHPMFLDRRVYQGSSGKVYPLPVYNRISEKAVDHRWKAVHIENEFLKLMVLPEIGGRIHIGQDKKSGYDFFYRQNVIKPALVGLTGPWASGGVEFNWPQHHRPATYMSVNVEIENHDDGSKTVWFSDHDPMARMKGMHGVCLHPGKAVLELKVRAYNRTPYVQTFLWWANVATRVHEGYQSFFPPDVSGVADHAKRSMSTYPFCDNHYYGVNYAKRAREGVPASENPADFPPPYLKPNPEIPAYAPNDLQWYANIPVPTSYMCIGSQEDFFGGYDHLAKAGVVHVANHHISPGKKQWTWGNHEFGYAWDRNLTDDDGPYIEIMAGVYTDNQPDFSYLQPGETKTWSQFWYPIQKIGPAKQANVDAAVSLRCEKSRVVVGAAVTGVYKNALVQLLNRGKLVQDWKRDLSPDSPLVETVELKSYKEHDLRVVVLNADKRELIYYQPAAPVERELPPPAFEPELPHEMKSVDELYLTGLHLEQYRHATRKPEAYWLEALKRDPDDSRCNNAMGLKHFRRGRFVEARACFEKAIARLTRLNPNPYDGEAYYNLGLTERFLGRDTEAYAAFYKATWNQAWQSAGYHAIAEIDACRGEWDKALDHLERSLRLNTDNLRARDLKTIALRKLGRNDEAKEFLAATLALDPLDWWARSLRGDELKCDTQTRIDLAIDCSRAGLLEEAIKLLETAKPEALSGTAPMIQYHLASLYQRAGDDTKAKECLKAAEFASPDYCFPSRLEDIAVLESAIALNPKDARAPFYLGCLFYDKDRFEDGLRLWEISTKRGPKFSIAWRNLGIAYFNIAHQPKKALAAFDTAFRLNPQEPRLLYERDQLWKRLGQAPSKRLRELESHIDLVLQRDDLAVELCALYNQTGQPAKASAILTSRKFQPWEGGEGLALGQHVRTHLKQGQAAMLKNDFAKARAEFESALSSPVSLGEAKHLLANQSDIHLWLGDALAALGEKAKATEHWTLAADYAGDFQGMTVRAFSEMTFFTARALERLGKKAKAKKLFTDLLKYSKGLEKQKAKIDYFATSLPTMLLFEDDLQARQTTDARFIQALAEYGLGRKSQALKLTSDVLSRDPSHGAAADLVSELKGMKR
jgi:tetratricopeptide (TPR) repeat protein